MSLNGVQKPEPKTIYAVGSDTAADTATVDTGSPSDTGTMDTYECAPSPTPSNWQAWTVSNRHQWYVPDVLVNYAQEELKADPQTWGNMDAETIGKFLRQTSHDKVTTQMVCDFISKNPSPELTNEILMPILADEILTPFDTQQVIYNQFVNHTSLASTLVTDLKNSHYRSKAQSILKAQIDKGYAEAGLALIETQVSRFNGRFEPLGAYGMDRMFGPAWHEAINETLTIIGLTNTQAEINWVTGLTLSPPDKSDGQPNEEVRVRAQTLLNQLDEAL